MPDQGEKTEKPTKKRADKAREEGRFAVSREFVSAIQFLCVVWVLGSRSETFLEQMRLFVRSALASAFEVRLDRISVVGLYRHSLFSLFVPLLLCGLYLMLVVFVAQLATTRLGFSWNKLSPDFKRLNPVQKLREAPKQGMTSLLQAMLLLPLFGYAVYRLASDSLPTYISLSSMAVQPALALMTSTYRGLLWKASYILLFLGLVDLTRQVKRHGSSLRMTKQEVKEEMKQMEGNPLIKQRVRRIQRDLARRSMMKEVPKATAVIVNPTHFAVAIRYDVESMAAPRVVAKGKNYLARRIREIANDHQVPVIENQPLAQALYKSAEIGQEIPPHLYRAVAEILAYLFKLMNRGRG